MAKVTPMKEWDLTKTVITVVTLRVKAHSFEDAVEIGGQEPDGAWQEKLLESTTSVELVENV